MYFVACEMILQYYNRVRSFSLYLISNDLIVLIRLSHVMCSQVRSTPQLCEVCHKSFRSRNKLFDHIKATGHARRKEPEDPTVTCDDDFGKKRKKKKGKK